MTEFLPVYRENAVDLLEEAIPYVVAGGVGYDLLLEVCSHYRVMGAINLLLDVDARGLHADLSRSANAFLFGLRSGVKGSVVASKAAPLFDGIACRDETTASAIAELLPREATPW